MKYFYAALVMFMALLGPKANCAAAEETGVLVDKPASTNGATYAWSGVRKAEFIMTQLSYEEPVSEDTVTKMLGFFEEFAAYAKTRISKTPDKDTESTAGSSAAPSTSLALIEKFEQFFIKVQTQRHAPASHLDNVKAFFTIFKKHANDVSRETIESTISTLKNILL